MGVQDPESTGSATRSSRSRGRQLVADNGTLTAGTLGFGNGNGNGNGNDGPMESLLIYPPFADPTQPYPSLSVLKGSARSRGLM